MINEKFFITPVAIINKEINLMNKYHKNNIFIKFINSISNFDLLNDNILKENYLKKILIKINI